MPDKEPEQDRDGDLEYLISYCADVECVTLKDGQEKHPAWLAGLLAVWGVLAPKHDGHGEQVGPTPANELITLREQVKTQEELMVLVNKMAEQYNAELHKECDHA